MSQEQITADDLCKSGFQAQKAGDKQGAYDYFNKAVAVAPENDEYYLYRATASFSLGNIEQFKSDLEQCLLLNPKNEAANKLLEMLRDGIDSAAEDSKNYDSSPSEAIFTKHMTIKLPTRNSEVLSDDEENLVNKKLSELRSVGWKVTSKRLDMELYRPEAKKIDSNGNWIREAPIVTKRYCNVVLGRETKDAYAEWTGKLHELDSKNRPNTVNIKDLGQNRKFSNEYAEVAVGFEELGEYQDAPSLAKKCREQEASFGKICNKIKETLKPKARIGFFLQITLTGLTFIFFFLFGAVSSWSVSASMLIILLLSAAIGVISIFFRRSWGSYVSLLFIVAVIVVYAIGSSSGLFDFVWRLITNAVAAIPGIVALCVAESESVPKS